nr:MAG TPA_asm: hypothetical protein [Caudoviricetes sp.]
MGNSLPYGILRFEKAVHVYGAWIRMIQKGSQWVGAARTCALSGPSCSCMKTTTQSGQAWRGYERAPDVTTVKLASICVI